MASYYVYSGAGGAGTGADWANAYTSLVTAVSGKAAGDIFYIAHDHAESSASATTVTSPGTVGNPCFFYCVNRAGSVPPVAADLTTGATIATTGNANLIINGSGYFYGLSWTAGNSTGTPTFTISNVSGHRQIHEASAFAMGSTGIAPINIGNSATVGANDVVHKNCTFSFAAVGQSIRPNATWLWENRPGSAALLGTIPTILIAYVSLTGIATLRGLDLSAAGSGKTLVASGSTGAHGYVLIEDCKLDASVTIQSNPLPGRPAAEVVRSDSGATNNRYDRYRYEATQTIETTIVRTGGASDGTTPIAWKIVTTADAKWMAPFECPPIAIWNDTTGSAVTATIEGIWGGGAVPNDDEIWVEVQYLGNASFPVASFVNDSKANALSSAAGQAAGSGTWGGSTTKFKLDVTFTPQMKGWIFARVKVAKASSTFYIDPKIALS